MKVKSEREVAQSCPTLSDPMDYSLPGSSIHGIFHVLEWGAIAFSDMVSKWYINTKSILKSQKYNKKKSENIYVWENTCIRETKHKQ